MKWMWWWPATLMLMGCTGMEKESMDQWTVLREVMVSKQIEARDVKDPRVVEAMRTVPRHLFVPLQHRDQAYEDHPLPIGYGQTISQPYIVALMTELLEVEPHHKVLEIGTGSGYQAAVLSLLCDTVYTIEIVPELGESARERLLDLGYRNVVVKIGDGYSGWPEEAPFDRIILTASPPEIPQSLIDQLKDGGILVAPVGEGYQELVRVRKENGVIVKQSIIPVRFVPMVRGKAED